MKFSVEVAGLPIEFHPKNRTATLLSSPVLQVCNTGSALCSRRYDCQLLIIAACAGFYPSTVPQRGELCPKSPVEASGGGGAGERLTAVHSGGRRGGGPARVRTKSGCWLSFPRSVSQRPDGSWCRETRLDVTEGQPPVLRQSSLVRLQANAVGNAPGSVFPNSPFELEFEHVHGERGPQFRDNAWKNLSLSLAGAGACVKAERATGPEQAWLGAARSLLGRQTR